MDLKPGVMLVLLLGCASPQENGDRAALTGALARTNSLVFRWVFDDALPWGAYVFTFETDAKTTVCVKVSKPDAASSRQRFWIWLHDLDLFELESGSALETRLLHLLQDGTTIGAVDNPDLLGAPSRVRLDWLLLHLKDRDLKWTPLP